MTRVYLTGIQIRVNPSKYTTIIAIVSYSLLSVVSPPQRPLWRHYFANTDAVLFVVDSNDRERISECRYELHHVMEDKELDGCILLVLANKQDLPNALSVEEITAQLDLPSLTKMNIKWRRCMNFNMPHSRRIPFLLLPLWLFLIVPLPLFLLHPLPLFHVSFLYPSSSPSGSHHCLSFTSLFNPFRH